MKNIAPLIFTVIALSVISFSGCSRASYSAGSSTSYWNEYYAERETDRRRVQNPEGQPYCEEMRICLRNCAEQNSPRSTRGGIINSITFKKLSDCERNCRSFNPCREKEK